MIFRLPIRIESESNKKEHWAIKYKRNEKSRYLINTIDLRECQIPCTIKLVRIAPRVLDYDNLVIGFKHVRDCVASKLIPGKRSGFADSDPRLTWEYDQKKGKPKEYAIEIQIK